MNSVLLSAGRSTGRVFWPELPSGVEQRWARRRARAEAAGQLWLISGWFVLPLPLPILDAEKVIVEGISAIACYLLFGDW